MALGMRIRKRQAHDQCSQSTRRNRFQSCGPVSWLTAFIVLAFPMLRIGGIVSAHDRLQWRDRAGFAPASRKPPRGTQQNSRQLTPSVPGCQAFCFPSGRCFYAWSHSGD